MKMPKPNFYGTVTITGTGSVDLTGFGLDPNDIEIMVLARGGDYAQVMPVTALVDSELHQGVKYDYQGPTSYAQKSPSSKSIYVREHTGGAWVEKLISNVSAYITDGITLNTTTYSGGSSYQLGIMGRKLSV